MNPSGDQLRSPKPQRSKERIFEQNCTISQQAPHHCTAVTLRPFEESFIARQRTPVTMADLQDVVDVQLPLI